MIELNGKKVLDSLDELVRPESTALVLVDMQNDFVHPEGEFGRLGVNQSMYPALRRNLSTLVAAARAAGVLLIHVQMTTLSSGLSDSAAHLRFNRRMHQALRPQGPPLRYTVVGTWGHEFIEEIAPAEGEPVVQKWRSSAFWGTNLDLVLRSNAIQTVIVTGCTTEGCVESTARDAMFNDYYVVIADDCVASDDPAQHDASMFLMRHRFDVASGTDIAEAWRLQGAWPGDRTATFEHADQMP